MVSMTPSVAQAQRRTIPLPVAVERRPGSASAQLRAKGRMASSAPLSGLGLGIGIAALLATGVAAAQTEAPANTLTDMRRQFAACLSGKPLGPPGSRVTIVFSMKRDGSIFGKPRITYSHLEGDAEARARFLEDAEQAVNACLPLKVTPALGQAIAGRMFVITLGTGKPERKA
jgi:hypothetical protein